MLRITKELPAEWDDYLMDEEDKVPAIPEAAHFLRFNAPTGYYLETIYSYPITGDESVKKFEFVYEKMRTPISVNL